MIRQVIMRLNCSEVVWDVGFRAGIEAKINPLPGVISFSHGHSQRTFSSRHSSELFVCEARPGELLEDENIHVRRSEMILIEWSTMAPMLRTIMKLVATVPSLQS